MTLRDVFWLTVAVVLVGLWMWLVLPQMPVLL
jgi:hypothetical protein